MVHKDPERDPAKDPIAALDAVVPEPIRQVCARLQEAGYEAFTVGGCVRDAILGREPKDWDVATSATPDEVMASFKKTIPTGIQHGTVTVLVSGGGGGKKGRIPVEVTTFRGEGAYSDGRRPDSVTFGVPLREDLARRDLIVNAMAYDPVGRVLADPFGGAEDISQKRLRAVGDARERFAEDGLRVMRAVRFAAVLEFDLDADTEAAITPSLPILAKVSRERVRDELLKMLGARQPSRGLVIARRTGLLASILPELAERISDDERWQATIQRVDAGEDRLLRLAALLLYAELPRGSDDASPLRRLRLSNAEIERVDRLLEFGPRWRSNDPSDRDLRVFLGALGRKYVADLLALWRAEQTTLDDDDNAAARLAELAERVRTIADRGDALTTGSWPCRAAISFAHSRCAPGRSSGRSSPSCWPAS